MVKTTVWLLSAIILFLLILIAVEERVATGVPANQDKLSKRFQIKNWISNEDYCCPTSVDLENKMKEGAFMEDGIEKCKNEDGTMTESEPETITTATTYMETKITEGNLGSSANTKSTTRQIEGNGKFLLLTDFHVDYKYSRDGSRTNMCHGRQGGSVRRKRQNQKLGAFGDRNCDSSMQLVEYMLGQAQKQLPKPDLIIWAGDTPAHVEYTKDELLETMRKGTMEFKKYFPDILLIPVLGNHDMRSLTSSGSQVLQQARATHISDKPEELGLYAEIFDMWEWIGESAKETFLRGGYYRFKAPLGNGAEEFLVLNTNLYYTSNSASFLNSTDPSGQFAFMANELADVRRNNGRIHILAHIPPGAYLMDSGHGTSWHPEMPEVYNQQLLSLMVEYASSIGLMLFGHLHTDEFRIVNNSAGEPIQRLFLNPAITPIFQLNNPAFRIFDYNRATFELVDIKTYYVNLDLLNKEGSDKVVAQLEYSMRQAYSLPSLDAHSMHDLVQRMAAANQTLFDGYSRHRTVMHNSNTSPTRAIHLCVIGNLDLEVIEQCIKI